jgi:hypothetical protein
MTTISEIKYLECLQPEVWDHVLSFCTPSDLTSFQSCSKLSHSLLSDQRLFSCLTQSSSDDALLRISRLFSYFYPVEPSQKEEFASKSYRIFEGFRKSMTNLFFCSEKSPDLDYLIAAVQCCNPISLLNNVNIFSIRKFAIINPRSCNFNNKKIWLSFSN